MHERLVGLSSIDLIYIYPEASDLCCIVHPGLNLMLRLLAIIPSQHVRAS